TDGSSSSECFPGNLRRSVRFTPPPFMLRTVALLCALLLAFSAPAFTLVEEGEPKAIIVVPDQPLPAEAFAAEELRHHVKLASGAELPIVPDRESIGRPEPT